MSGETKNESKFLGLYLTVKEFNGDLDISFTSSDENQIDCECVFSLPNLKMTFQSQGDTESSALQVMSDKLKPIVDQISREYLEYMTSRLSTTLNEQ